MDSTPNDKLDGQPLALGGGATALSAAWSPTTSSSAVDAYSYVIANAGAQPRDQVDSLVIADVTSLGQKGSMWKSQTATGARQPRLWQRMRRGHQAHYIVW